MSKAKNVVKFPWTWAKWVLAGRPKRSDAEITRIFAICQRCPEYDAEKSNVFGKGVCTVCGCHVSLDKSQVNKLAMPDQSCPLNKWQATVGPNPNESVQHNDLDKQS